MSGPAQVAEVPIVVEVADWLRIDAVMDNEIRDLQEQAGTGEDGPDPLWTELTELAESIRQAGWDQLPGWPKTSKGFGSWPAPGQTQAIRLSGRQWGLVVSTLERWAALNEQDNHDAAAFLRRIAEAVRAGFKQQGAGALPAVRLEW